MYEKLPTDLEISKTDNARITKSSINRNYNCKPRIFCGKHLFIYNSFKNKITYAATDLQTVLDYVKIIKK